MFITLRTKLLLHLFLYIEIDIFLMISKYEFLVRLISLVSLILQRHSTQKLLYTTILT